MNQDASMIYHGMIFRQHTDFSVHIYTKNLPPISEQETHSQILRPSALHNNVHELIRHYDNFHDLFSGDPVSYKFFRHDSGFKLLT